MLPSEKKRTSVERRRMLGVKRNEPNEKPHSKNQRRNADAKNTTANSKQNVVKPLAAVSPKMVSTTKAMVVPAVDVADPLLRTEELDDTRLIRDHDPLLQLEAVPTEETGADRPHPAVMDIDEGTVRSLARDHARPHPVDERPHHVEVEFRFRPLHPLVVDQMIPARAPVPALPLALHLAADRGRIMPALQNRLIQS